MESACEKALFASADTVASATAYVAARLVLLSQAAASSGSRPDRHLSALAGLRRGLEADRFGFVAQVLASLYGCTADRCDAFRLFANTDRLRANLEEATYGGFVSRNAAAWPARPVRPAMANAPAAHPTGPSPVPPGFNVPSAASIPPVSIMNPEPPPPAAASPAPEASAAPVAPARRPARSAPRPAANAPVPILPPGATAATAGQ